jgi:geranylgeranyl pyrophosphate synthase
MLGEGKNLSIEELDAINAKKTGALLAASCAMGVASADGMMDQEKAGMQFGRLLGLAFQIRDDMLDVLSTESELGKPIGSDAAENKNTYMALMGQYGCEKEIERLSNLAISELQNHFADTDFLTDLTKRLATRKK